MLLTLVCWLLALIAASEEACYSKDNPYYGTVSWTITGKECQYWVADCPQAHNYHNDSMFVDGRQVYAENFCRSPDGEHWPWCYTNDPETRWEYCPVAACDDDCFTEGMQYSGLVAHTVSGRICQSWSMNSPHKHSYHDNNLYPEGSQVEAENYCRNPDKKYWQPWCYTDDQAIRWEYCDVENCYANDTDVYSDEQCFSEGSPYNGTVTQTIGGHTCQQWSKNSPHDHNYHKSAMFPDGSQASAENFCRNPDGVYWPWCYTTNPKVRWDYCHVEACEDDCFTNETPYDGPLKYTLGGYECQPWATDSPHEHTYHNDSYFPEGSQSLAENFCRNPGDEDWWPWCYTTDPNVRWDYCPVEGCYALEDEELSYM